MVLGYLEVLPLFRSFLLDPFWYLGYQKTRKAMCQAFWLDPFGASDQRRIGAGFALVDVDAAAVGRCTGLGTNMSWEPWILDTEYQTCG